MTNWSNGVVRPNLDRISSYDDARAKARRVLPRGIYEYVDGGADAEATLRRNTDAFDELVWKPRQAVFHDRIELATEVLGTRLSMPVMTAPCGGARLVHPDGDVGLARAAVAGGTCHIASAVSGYPLEEIAAAAGGPAWFQLYRLGSRPLMESLVHRAQAAGFGALVVTIDSVVVGYREKDYRNGFTLSMKVNPRTMLKMVPQVITHPRWLYDFWRDGMPFEIANTRPLDGGEAMPISSMGRTDLSHSPTWDEIDWIRATWTGPLVIKGVMTPTDARRAVDAGADGIVVSNHGGRQLDGSPATIDVLPDIVAEVGGQCAILLDSGIRRANDVARAVALGADAVLIGRMSMYGLAVGGEAGVGRMLSMLRQELVRILQLVGVGSIHDLDPAMIERAGAVGGPTDVAGSAASTRAAGALSVAARRRPGRAVAVVGSGAAADDLATAVAGRLSRHVVRVDLGPVVSTYVDEAERHLDRVLAASDTAGAVVLFDEADALFGRRSAGPGAASSDDAWTVARVRTRLPATPALVLFATRERPAAPGDDVATVAV